MDQEGAGTPSGNKDVPNQQMTTPTYLSFLEKQVERANRAYLNVESLRDQIGHLKERIDLVELQGEDTAKKVQIIASYEGHQINRRAIENLNGRLADLESAAGKKVGTCLAFDTGMGAREAIGSGRTSECFIGTQTELENRVCQAVVDRFNSMLAHNETYTAQKCAQMIDEQGREIAQDMA